MPREGFVILIVLDSVKGIRSPFVSDRLRSESATRPSARPRKYEPVNKPTHAVNPWDRIGTRGRLSSLGALTGGPQQGLRMNHSREVRCLSASSTANNTLLGWSHCQHEDSMDSGLYCAINEEMGGRILVLF